MRRDERLEAAGYEQYEISETSRARAASTSQFEILTDGDWDRARVRSHSTLQGVRWKNVPATEDYIGRAAAGGVDRRLR